MEPVFLFPHTAPPVVYDAGGDLSREASGATEMLVLSRETGESIIIGEMEIEITVLEMNRGRVRIGVQAPKSIAVHRREVYMKIQRDKQRIESENTGETA